MNLMMDSTNITFITASEAIEQQLKTLGLWEFPCGPGSWREPQPISKLPSKKQKSKFKEVKSTVPEKVDCSEIERIKLLAEKEKTEALQELVNSQFSPWHIDYTWSNESNELREIAVKTPWLLNADFVLSYLKTVRICDKNVTIVDKKILELKNLEELTLSANYITSINSLNIPKKLKILELCANQISDVSSLCLRPPPLQHLGLSKNLISFLGDCFSGPYWPNLLSLDLSHNDLCGLVNVISTLSTLPKLRHLILNGNPLSLGLAYRGHTIDTIKQLAVFDDKHISVDEKLSCHGISTMKEVIRDEAHFQIHISYVKGIPCPDEIKNKDQNQDMFVERLYFVQFEFPEDRKYVNKRDTHEDVISVKDGEGGVEKCHSEQMMARATDSTLKKLLMSQTSQPDTNVGEMVSQSEKGQHSEILTVPYQSKAPDVNTVIEETPVSIEAAEGVHNDLELTFEENPPVTVIKTTPLPWAQEQTLNCLMDFKRKDLLALRNFFRKGMQMSVVEQLIIGTPDLQSAALKEEKGGKGKSNKSLTKQKPMEEKIKSGQKNLKKDSKKKKETDHVKLDPVFSTVASFNIPLELFLDGEYEYKNVFTELNLPPPTAIPSNEDANYNKSKEKKRETDGQQDRNRSARKSPGKDKGKKKETPDIHLESGPKGLEMEVTMKLRHWLTVKDIVRV
ncbi:unnamed protein product [Lymnaea stagnalis]|uniref:Leucine-rich repeat-containing protein 43 n=1 Tax=Lymnaea stagnalis TaxID=6523 RepID=A0AAV2HMS8_LYMST